MPAYTGPMYITVTSMKGGCGKTTTATSLAHGLARAGHSTLLIDVDPQGHCAICLGFDPANGVFRWLTHEDIQPLENFTLVARPGVDVDGGWANLALLPGDSQTKHIPRFYSRTGDFEGLCDRMIGMLDSASYDYILFDTPASGLLQEAAIAIAHLVIIPFRPETLGLDGVAATLDVVRQLAERRPAPNLSLLPVMYDRRLTEHDYNLSVVRNQYGPLVADPIPARIAVAEAVAMGRTIWEMHSEGARDAQAAYGKLLTWIQSLAALSGRQPAGAG